MARRRQKRPEPKVSDGIVAGSAAAVETLTPGQLAAMPSNAAFDLESLRALAPQILLTLPDPIFIFEIGRGWVFVNSMACQLLAAPPLKSESGMQLDMPKGFSRMMNHMHERVVASGRPSRIEFYAKHRALGPRWWSGLWSPLWDDNRQLRAVFVLHRDVSEQTELQGSLIRDRKKLHLLATTDPLTKLANRRSFLEESAKLMGRNGKPAGPLAIILYDIDHFKSVNDRFGHAAGDEVLRSVAAISRKQVRPHDILARWGGEEFIVCLPQTDRPEAAAIAERVRRAIEADPIMAEGSSISVSASFGVASTPEGPEFDSLEQLINQADLALYEAKRQGRNRVTEFTEEPELID